MKIYLDNAATTQLDAEVLSAMLPYFSKDFGNASSLHSYGRDSAKAVDSARDIIAKSINAKPNEIYITSGGTESDNWVFKGVVSSSKLPKKHIITSCIEHPAIIETCAFLEKQGVEVTYLSVDSKGIVNPKDVEDAIKDNTILISVMYANNEIGSIQPIKEIGAIAKEYGIPFHTDAVQAMGSLNIDVERDNIDLMSCSAHKFHGPKGIGFLYIKQGIRIEKLIIGGHQERRQRAGTTNTPLIVGMAKAIDIAVNNRDKDNIKIKSLRNYLIDSVLKEIPFSHLNGGIDNRLPNNANLSFDFIEGESLLMILDLNGIAVSSGSACSSGSLEASHVILALGVREEQAHSSIRFSLGRDTTKEEIDYTIKTLKESVKKLRSFSPLFNEQTGEGSYV